MRRFDWRAIVDRVVRLWRSSLQLRTVTIAVLLSAVVISVIGVYMSMSIRNNLFESRRDQLMGITASAVVQAQSIFDTAVADSGLDGLEAASVNAFRAIQRTAATAGEDTVFALLRTPGQDTPRLLIDARSPGFEPDATISEQLRDAVAQADQARLYTQPVAADGDASRPALAIGAPIEVAQTDRYELYLVYELDDAERTLTFVQQTIGLGSVALVVLLGAVTYLVVRLVVGPVRVAAETSQKLAAGQLEERIPEHGEDVIATLARSFNGMADSLQQQITRLATLSRVQQRFVSDVSHELRTPLTTIRLAGDVLYDRRDSFDAATARSAELLRAQVQRFELLLADLLEMSRYDAGAVQLETEPVNLVRLAEDTIEAVGPLAESEQSPIRLVAPGGYFEADVDVRRIRRILQNLLGNAIDHGEGRPIVVYVDSDEDAVAIAVRDYGVGMTEAQAARVFDRFWRADPSRQRTTGGTGLGLAISLEDAALHGGWLEVWSSPGEGSCFRLTLPRRRGEQLHSSPLDLPPSDGVPARDTEVP